MESIETQKIIAGCNPAQVQAIIHDHQKSGPLLILAGAGSGKTAVLTRRMQWLIQCRGVAAENILGLTFTAKAAAEMRERMTTATPLLSTFHSLALRLLRDQQGGIPNWKRMGFSQAPLPVEQNLGQWINHLLDCGVAGRKVEREDLFNPDWKWAPGQAERVRQPFLESAKVSFDDLIWLAIALLEQYAAVRDAVQQQWRYCLVDEYQDINPEQYRLVRLIVGASPNLFVVGDDDQAIYGFRGADVRNILRFQDDFPQCTVVKLELNYRSTPAILALANQIFTNKPQALRKCLQAGSLRQDALFRANAPVEVWQSDNSVAEFERVVERLHQWRAEYGLEWSAFAILVRFHRLGEWYEAALQENGIPVGTEAQGVAIETVHASKGLQYPIVFYAGIAEGLTPSVPRTKNKTKIEAHQEEERRLFYVGVTRAECRLVLLFCKRRHWQGALQAFQPSRYLKVVDPQKKRKIRMLVLRKLLRAINIVIYMGISVLQELGTRIVGRNSQEWIDAKLLRWAQYSNRKLGFAFNTQGREHLADIDWNRPVFIVCNHQSYMDIPVLLEGIGRRFGFVAKKELTAIPLLGYWMKKIGCLIIDRKKRGIGVEIADSIRQSALVPKIAIFPEGTRSKTGQLGAFKSGAFRYVVDFEGTLLPVVLKNTRAAWEDRQDFNIVHGECRILAPLDMQKKPLNHKDLMALVRETMEKNL